MQGHDQANTMGTMNGLFKDIYAKDVTNLMPDGVKLLKKEIEFRTSDLLGNKYHQPITLSNEHGITYGRSGSGVYDLNPPVPAIYEDAVVDGTEIVGKSAITFGAAARASKGEKSFVNGTENMVTNLMNSVSKRLEVGIINGGSSIGEIESTAKNGSFLDVKIKNNSFAPGIWAGGEKMRIDIYGTEQRNSEDAPFIIRKIRLETRTITISGTLAQLKAVAADDSIYYQGAKDNEFLGMMAIAAKQGELFGIDTNKYSLWNGNVYPVNDKISVEAIVAAVDLAVNKGLEEDCHCIISSTAFSALADSLEKVRAYDKNASFDNQHAGMESITIHAQNGRVTIMPHLYCKRGEGIIAPLKYFKRIGASDITFKVPGRSGDDFFSLIPGKNAYELSLYTDQALFCDRPCLLTKMTGITTADSAVDIEVNVS